MGGQTMTRLHKVTVVLRPWHPIANTSTASSTQRQADPAQQGVCLQQAITRSAVRQGWNPATTTAESVETRQCTCKSNRGSILTCSRPFQELGKVPVMLLLVTFSERSCSKVTELCLTTGLPSLQPRQDSDDKHYHFLERLLWLDTLMLRPCLCLAFDAKNPKWRQSNICMSW